MNWNDIEIGKVYGSRDDASYLILRKTDDWICLLHYSSNHRVATSEIFSRLEDEKWIEKWEEYESFYIDEIFDNLEYKDSFTLKINEK